MISVGLTQLLRGLRRGSTPLTVVGMALLLLGLFRRRAGSKTVPVYVAEVGEGEELRVRVVPDYPETR